MDDDDKFVRLHDKVEEGFEKQEARFQLSIEKLEGRMAASFADKLRALKDLIDQSNTARTDALTIQLNRIQCDSKSCGERCTAAKSGFERRIKRLEDWKLVNWQRIVAYLVVGGVAASQLIDWLIRILPKGKI